MPNGHARLVLVALILSTLALLSGAIAQPTPPLVTIGFASRPSEPDDAAVRAMVDEAIAQVLGPNGLRALISPGNKVVMKVNIVAPTAGAPGDRGRGAITDARIVRYVAEQVRAIIGTGGTASLKVVDATFSGSTDPSETGNVHSFYFARLERTGNDSVDAGDVTYDANHDGILDGTSGAQLVNLDSIPSNDRYTSQMTEPTLGKFDVSLPKIIRTRAQAEAAGEPNTYCDVFLGLPLLKSHHYGGLSAAMKLHYGLRDMSRFDHSGTTDGPGGFGTVKDPVYLREYLVGMHRLRDYDLIIMDCITGNRSGPDAPDRSNANCPIDYILMNSVMASRDTIAIDTVGALFAGYDPHSIGFLAQGRLDGLGTDQPGMISVSGLDSFTRQRNAISAKYAPAGKYPFREGWGDAHAMSDFSAPTSVSLAVPVPASARTYSFKWSARDNNTSDTGLARVELLIDGAMVAYRNTDLKTTGTLQADLSAYAPITTHTCQIAAWDNALNCTLSTTQPLVLKAMQVGKSWRDYR